MVLCGLFVVSELCSLCIMTISSFNYFECWNLVLIASVPGLCIRFTMI